MIHTHAESVPELKICDPKIRIVQLFIYLYLTVWYNNGYIERKD